MNRCAMCDGEAGTNPLCLRCTTTIDIIKNPDLIDLALDYLERADDQESAVTRRKPMRMPGRVELDSEGYAHLHEMP